MKESIKWANLTVLVLGVAAFAMATCPNQPDKTYCTCAQSAIFQDVGARVGVTGRYYMSHPSLTHNDAQYACSRVNGHLLEIDTQYEMDLIRRAIEDLLMDTIEIHIGGQYIRNSGHIVSEATTGRQLYSDWHGGHPISRGGSVLCVTLYNRSRDRGLKMGSLDCLGPVALRFICEI